MVAGLGVPIFRVFTVNKNQRPIFLCSCKHFDQTHFTLYCGDLIKVFAIATHL